MEDTDKLIESLSVSSSDLEIAKRFGIPGRFLMYFLILTNLEQLSTS